MVTGHMFIAGAIAIASAAMVGHFGFWDALAITILASLTSPMLMALWEVVRFCMWRPTPANAPGRQIRSVTRRS